MSGRYDRYNDRDRYYDRDRYNDHDRYYDRDRYNDRSRYDDRERRERENRRYNDIEVDHTGVERISNLSIHDIIQEDELDQDRAIKQYYIPKLNDVCHDIKDARKHLRSNVTYEVRLEEIDPFYNFMDCCSFIIRELKRKGFKQTKFIKPNKIRISWINEAIEKEKIERLHHLYGETRLEEEKGIYAPAIMWYGNESRYKEHKQLEMNDEYIAGTSLRKKKKEKILRLTYK